MLSMFNDCVFYLVDQKDIVFRVGFDELHQDSENRVLKQNKLANYLKNEYLFSFLGECLSLLLNQSLLETLHVSFCEATWQNVVDLLLLQKFINSNTEVFYLHLSFHSRNISEPSKDLLLDLLNILLTQNTPQGLGLEK